MKSVPDGAHALLVTLTGEVLLVTKGPQYTFDPRNAGKVGMFGGGIEDGEGAEDALRRELREELELDIAGKPIERLGTYRKTLSEDGMDCAVHVFVVHQIDPTLLILHEGDYEDAGGVIPPDYNEQIVTSSVDVLLARNDLTRITRLALIDYERLMGSAGANS